MRKLTITDFENYNKEVQYTFYTDKSKKEKKFGLTELRTSLAPHRLYFRNDQVMTCFYAVQYVLIEDNNGMDTITIVCRNLDIGDCVANPELKFVVYGVWGDVSAAGFDKAKAM